MDMNGKMYSEYVKKGVKWYDPALLQYLEDNHIKSTLFMSGLFIKAYPGIVKDLAVTDLFSFENHAYDESAFVPHCYWLKTLKSDVEKVDQIRRTEEIIKQATGQAPKYFRYPGICHDRSSDKLVASLGFVIDNGTVIPGDPFSLNTEEMVRVILNEAKDGSVVIMHVGGKNAPKSLEVLKQIVPVLEARGYEFARF